MSRKSVHKVVRSGQADAPALEREEQLTPHLERIRELYASCRGNLVRVHEELEAEGVRVGYSTLTAFCRRHGLAHKTKPPAGRYEFDPGEEMQHDTSPHSVEVGGARRLLQCASLVLCYSRLLFAQCYTRWSRFECRVFLTAALRYFGGAAGRCMVDNSSVVIAHGTGADAVPAAEMAALGERFGFKFAAHEVGDADRSARVETNFGFIENNFYPGRHFADVADLNAQMLTWCDGVNRSSRRLWGQIRAVPMELFCAERTALRPLPLHVPEVYEPYSRRVDVEGYVSLHTNRYSAPPELVGRQLEVRESIEQVRLFDGRRLLVEHPRLEPGLEKRQTHPDHQDEARRRLRRRPAPPPPEEAPLRAASPELGAFVDALKKRYGGHATKRIKRLHRIWRDYPTAPVVDAAATALAHGLLDLARLERMVLRRIGGDFFRLPLADDGEHDDPDPENGDG